MARWSTGPSPASLAGDRRRLGEIDRQTDRVAADLARGGLGASGVAAGQHNPLAARRQRFGDGEADAARSAKDNARFALAHVRILCCLRAISTDGRAAVKAPTSPRFAFRRRFG